jgi:FeS assembly SUF system regulator
LVRYSESVVMLKVSRLTDYGVLLLGHLARQEANRRANTRDLADECGLPMDTVGKILKALAREGLLISHRGVNGGYTLARPPERISMAEVYGALEGPIAVAQSGAGVVATSTACPYGSNWRLIDEAVGSALRGISLLDMIQEWFAASR